MKSVWPHSYPPLIAPDKIVLPYVRTQVTGVRGPFLWNSSALTWASWIQFWRPMLPLFSSHRQPIYQDIQQIRAIDWISYIFVTSSVMLPSSKSTTWTKLISLLAGHSPFAVSLRYYLEGRHRPKGHPQFVIDINWDFLLPCSQRSLPQVPSS